MSRIRDHLSDLRWRAANGRVRVSNAWYRAAGRRIFGTRQQYRNWLSTRARARGKAPLPDRVTRAAGSRVPVYRNRVNPATGRQRRNDRTPASRPARACPYGNCHHNHPERPARGRTR